MSGFSFNNQYNSSGHEHVESRRRRNAPYPQYQPLSNVRPYTNDARRRRRRYFENVLNSTSPAVSLFSDWTTSIPGLLATRRISRIGRYSTMRPNRDSLLYGQRPVTLATYNAGQTNYNAVMRDQNGARYNPSHPRYNSAQRYLDYQRSFNARPISTRQFYGTAGGGSEL